VSIDFCITLLETLRTFAAKTAAKIFETLAKSGINVMMISQNPSESSITIVVKNTDLNKAVSSLEMELLGKIIKKLEVTTDVAIINTPITTATDRELSSVRILSTTGSFRPVVTPSSTRAKPMQAKATWSLLNNCKILSIVSYPIFPYEQI